ncbi:MAG: metallophosphoesterase [Trueperaceae bacterium]|nr:metallophosphoesterase [Trueperaceae bacterium]
MSLDRRQLLKLAVAGGLAALGGWGVWSIYRPQRSDHRVRLGGLEHPLTLVQLSDLHLGPYLSAEVASGWVAQTMAVRPDLIVITGDVVDRRFGGDLGALSATLAGLSAPLGVWAVWGNHDHGRYRPIAPLARALTDAGIGILDNDGVRLRDDLYLAGVDDLLLGRPDLSAALRKRPADDRGATLLLSHHPDFLLSLTPDVSLTLCGHTHGGQIQLPGGVPLYVPAERRFAQGWIGEPALGYVSRGLGVSSLPLRLNCPPELVVMGLEPST